jgi:small multidrug resistance pump
MGWVFLAAAIGFEIAGTVNLKLADGLTRLWPSLAVGPLYLLSFACLSLALKTVPLAVAYAIWSAVGIAAIAAIGMTWFAEPVSAPKLAGLILIVAGVALLQWADQAPWLVG